MTMLTKIGNSQGVRIPKPLIRQAHLEDAEIEFVVVEDGLLLKPVGVKRRQKWAENIDAVLSKSGEEADEGLLDEFLNDSDLEVWEW